MQIAQVELAALVPARFVAKPQQFLVAKLVGQRQSGGCRSNSRLSWFLSAAVQGGGNQGGT